ncbi:phosphonate ABC transporter substrate-binding protein, partial [Thiopseudomonas sp. 4R-3cl]
GLADANQGEVCTRLRSDGRIIEVAGDYTETLTRLQVQPQALGVFGLNFYEQNRDRLQVASIDGVMPSLETIGEGTYPVSRPLFFYIKGEHIKAVPGLSDFVEYFLSDAVSGYGSPLEEAGLIPLSDDERQTILNDFVQRKAIR